MTTTRIYKRLPSDAGVTFEGFENIKLKTREIVREKLEEFMEYCKNAQKPAIRVILGEWGEGKTDAYKRYIKPKAEADGNYAFFVSASTLSNGYEAFAISELLKTTSLSAVRFLVVLFNCIKEESGERKIPDPKDYQKANSYLEDALHALIDKEKKRRIFIFIDEFEELLLTPNRLRDIISGIKEMINEGKEYAGCLHFVIAATPDAFYRLQVDNEFANIFGGFERRAGVIELPQIRKEEGITFLFELLKYSYENNLPDPLPFSNLGIFNVIFRISQGNPGSMVSLFTRLMNSIRIDEKSIRIISSERLIKFLEKEYIFVYGGSTPCLESETFYRYLRIVEDQKAKDIGEKCSLLLKTIVGELKPFSVDELEKRIKYKDVKNLIAIINDDLKNKEGIEKTILKVSPLRQGKTFQDIQNAFKDFITAEKGEKFIKIDNYSEKLEAFEDKISFFEYENGNIIRRIYLPSDEDSIKSFFEGITDDRAVEIESKIKKLCENEEYYIASDEILSQIFPTPIPKELDFIKNREKRLKLWREVTKNLAEEYKNHIAAAFTYILEKSKDLTITITEKEKDYTSGAYMAELTVEGMKINSVFLPINGDVKGVDIEDLSKIVRRKPPIHIVFLIYTGELTQEAEDKIEDKKIGKKGENIIFEVRIHPTLAKRIICVYKARFSMPEEIEEKNLSSVINKLVIQELDILTKIKNWLKQQEEKGIVISELRLEGTLNYRDLADTLKFFINFMEYEGTIDEIFNKNQELLKYTLYSAKKVALIPDIQFPKFTKIVKDLLDNRFLVQEKNKYKIQYHPVENRILRILEKEKKVSQEELEAHFILKPSRYLIDIFLPILEYKGLIKKEGNNYLLNNVNELLSSIEDLYKRFKNIAKQYKDFGYIYMTKERGERFISLTEFETLIDRLYGQTQEMIGLRKEVALQKLSLIKRFLEHFFEDLLPLVKKASKESESVLLLVHETKSRIDDRISKIVEECDKWFKLKFKTENVTEYKQIQKLLKEIEDLKIFDENNIKEIVKRFKDEEKEKFKFSNDETLAYYFNPKFYKLFTLYEEIEKIEKGVKNTMEKLENHFKNFDERQKSFKSKLKDKMISEKYRISYLILENLGQLSQNPFTQAQPSTLETVNLNELPKIIQENIGSINSYFDSLIECSSYLDGLYNIEKKFVEDLEKSRSLCSHILDIFDIEGYNGIAKDFKDKLDKIVSEYNGYSQEIHFENFQSLSKNIEDFKSKIDNLEKRLNEARDSINSKWKEYINSTKSFIINIEDLLKLLQKISPDAEKIKNQLNVIQQLINLQVSELNLKLSELEQIKHNIRDELYETFKKVLTNDEFRLIEFLVKKIREERKEWLPLEDVYQSTKIYLNMDSSRVEELLRKLIKQGILKEGIALAFR